MIIDEPRGAVAPDPRDIDDRDQFAAMLTLVKDRAGLTTRDVAARTGIALATVGDYFAGRHLPSVRQTHTLIAILTECGVTRTAEQDEWRAALARVRPTRKRRAAGTQEPYRGLSSFTQRDADWFFGRDELVAELTTRVTSQRHKAVPIMVIGPSGSGKSSLLHAGLIPALTEQGGWSCLSITPGARPLSALTVALASARRPEGSRLLVVIDQFEEVFTACEDEQERTDFLDLIGHVPDALVVLGMRADCYEHAARHRQLIPILSNTPFVVGPMSEAQLRDCITQPARKAGVLLESGLVEVLLRDLAPSGAADAAAHDVGALPLLSHALLATWLRTERGRMTVAGYRAGGGIERAVAQSADEVYHRLTDTRRGLARHIFLRLVRMEANTAGSRVHVAFADLLPSDVTAAELTEVLDEFVEQRLITSDAEGLQITHEALIGAWPLLREWLDATRTDLRTRRQLGEAARAWQDAGNDPSGLWRGVLLDSALAWAGDPPPDVALNQLEQRFLATSVAAQTDRQRAERRQVRRLRRLIAGLAVLVVVSGTLTGYVIVQNDAAITQRDLAESRQVAGEAERLRADDPGLAAQLSVAATRIAVTPEARAAVLESTSAPLPTRLLGPPGVLQALAVAPGKALMAAATNAEIRLWDVRDHDHPIRLGAPLTGPSGTVFSLAFNPQGTLLAAAGADHVGRLWNVADPARPRLVGTLTGPANTVYSVAFTPDGSTIAAGSADHHVYRWNIADPAHPVAEPALADPGGAVQSVAFSGDGGLIAAGDTGGTVRVWPAHRQASPVVLAGPIGTVYSVAFAPDGHTVAAGSADHDVYLWNVATPSAAATRLTGFTSWVNAVAFSIDGTTLAAGGSDNTVRIWRLRDHKVTATFPHPGPVTAIAFLAGDDALATASSDGTARIWALPTPQISTPTDSVFSVDFSGDGRLVAIAPGSADDTVTLWHVGGAGGPTQAGPAITPIGASRFSGSAALASDGGLLAVGHLDGSVQLWNVADPAHPAPIGAALTGDTALIESLSFSHDGRLLAAAGDDHTVRLWDITNPGAPRLLSVLRGFANYVYTVTFSPDGRTLAASSADRTVRLWDIANPAAPHALATLHGPTNYVYTVVFSPDGRTLAAGSADDTVRLWDVTDPARPTTLGAPLVGPANYVYALAFSPDGRTLAGGSGDGTVSLWDMTNRAAPARIATLTDASVPVLSVAFSPRGGLLAAAGQDDTVRFYATDLASAAREVCDVAGDPVTAAEWRQYVPGIPYDPPCRGQAGVSG